MFLSEVKMKSTSSCMVHTMDFDANHFKKPLKVYRLHLYLT